MAAARFAFGPFLLDTGRETLFEHGVPVSIGSRALALLRALTEARGQIVTKSALMDAAWPNVSVEESNLTVQIAELRRWLRGSPDSEDWIATFPRVGYRFVGPLSIEGPAAPAPRADEKPAIAVLPFQNLSGDPEQVYFSDGITDDVITELSRFRQLMVIARNSSFAFRGKSMDVREIGRALGASYVIEGNVRRTGNRVRITVQLIDAASGAHVWAERYDRAIEDVFALQEGIAQSIVATVAQRVIDADEIAARRRPPEDIRAYDLFLKGLRLGDTFTPEAQAQVEAYYEQARAVDPTFARAYTGLAFVHNNRSVDVIAGVQPQPDEHRLSALRLAEQALALDPNDPRVHSTLAMMSTRVRDFERAERHYDLARAMNPNDATIQIYWAWAQACFGRPEDGLPAADLAFRLNPRHPRWYSEYLSRIL